MENITQKDIDWLLNLDASNPSTLKPENKTKNRRVWATILMWGLLLVFCGVMPFYTLIRISVFLNISQDWNAWLSIGGGIAATVLLLFIYIVILIRKLDNRRAVMKAGLYGLSILVFSFSFYGVMYVSSVHTKNDEIREVYRSLHPVLRMAVATTTLADNDLVITDISRKREDYETMGLAVNERSLHFEQESGFVHAIDLRTIGRNEFRNRLLQFSLNMFGFQTIRHTGTADHLHVALPVQ